MKKSIYFLMLSFFLVVDCANAQLSASRVPYKLVDDFETGELFGWEPFPYNQDGGYDALYFARKSPTYNSSKYALARPVRANESAELSHGFTKRLNMWTTADTRIRVAIYLQSDRNAGKLELSLGTYDGRRYFHTVQKPEAKTADNAADTVAGFTTDANRFTASFDLAGLLHKAYFEGSSFEGYGLSLKAEHPMTAAASGSADEINLELQSDQETTITVSMKAKPSAVLLKGQALRRWVFNEQKKTLTIKLQQGRTDMGVRLN